VVSRRNELNKYDMLHFTNRREPGMSAGAAIDGALLPAESSARRKWSFRPEWLPTCFGAAASNFIVWGTWAFLVVALVAYVVKFGANIPYGDEWEWIPQLVGDEPVTFSWLWSQHNEHRVPVPRLLYLGLMRISGNDFRAGMFFDAMMLASTSAFLLLAVKWTRGKTSLVDAFIPLILLHPGQYENLLWSFQVSLVVPCILAFFVLRLITSIKDTLTGSGALMMGTCLILMVLCGSIGTMYAIPIGLWIACDSSRRWFAGAAGTKKDALISLVVALVSLLASGLYFVGYANPPGTPPRPGAAAIVQVGLEFWSMSLGAPLEYWTVSAGLVSMLMIASVFRLAFVAWSNSVERTRALGMLAFLASFGALAAGVGLGRSCYGSGAGLTSRYMTLGAPGLVCIFFTWLLYGGTRSRQVVLVGMYIMLAATTVMLRQPAKEYARNRQNRLNSFAADIIAGVPLPQLTRTHAYPTGVYPHDRNGHLSCRLLMLRHAGVGVFQHIQD